MSGPPRAPKGRGSAAVLLALPALLAVLAGAAPAQADDLALIVGVGTAQRADGPPEPLLSLADDDAWRMAALVATQLPPERLRVLTQLDESTVALPFPGGPPGEPTRAALLSAIEALRSEAGPGPHRFLVYLAAHGTSEDLYLADGPTSVAALRAALSAPLGADDALLLIADACFSARWRGDGGAVARRPRFPLVEPSETGAVEVVVDSQTPERADAGGGVLTYLLSSGLAGAADANNDGLIGIQELSDHTWSYMPQLAAELQPAFRAPGADPHALVWRQGPGPRLPLSSTTPTRWLVTRPDGLPLLEATTRPGHPRSLALPPGRWTVWELPLQGGATEAPGPVAYKREALLAASGEAALGPRGPTGAPRRLLPGGRLAEAELGPRLPVWTTVAPPALLPRLRAAPRTRLEALATYSPTALALPEAALIGGGARALRRVGEGGQRLWIEGGGAAGQGGEARLSALQLGLGHELDLLTAGPLNLVWDSGIGVHHVKLNADGLEQATGGPRLLLGPRALLWADGPGLVGGLGLRARPGLLRVERDLPDGSTEAGWQLDAADLGAELSLGLRL